MTYNTENYRFEKTVLLSRFKSNIHNQFKFTKNGEWIINKNFSIEYVFDLNIINNYFKFEDENTCPICCESFYIHQDKFKYISCIKCKKEYGVECLLRWIRNGKNSCPSCRTDIIKIETRSNEWIQDYTAKRKHDDTSERFWRAYGYTYNNGEISSTTSRGLAPLNITSTIESSSIDGEIDENIVYEYTYVSERRTSQNSSDSGYTIEEID